MAEDSRTRVSWGPGLHAVPGRPVNMAAYEGYVGRWSRLFVPVVSAAARIRPGDRVLDVATGPGEAAVVALSDVGASGFVVGADIALSMLDVARDRFPGLRFRPVATNGEALPFCDGVFDAVICQLGLMFFAHPARGLEEFRRVLRPGGRAAISVISASERAPMWGILADTLSGHLPDQHDVLHLSFALADPQRLEALMAAAGFRDIRIQRQTREGSFESFADYWAPFEDAAGSLPQAYRALPEPLRRAVRQQVQSRLADYDSGGRIVMNLEVLIASGEA